MSQIPTTEIRQGKHDGQTLWICHYNRPDMQKKALRCVPPTKCLVRPVSETNKKVYYSQSFFSPIGKSGKPLSKVIGPMDNTGFRSNPGNPLLVFEHEQECIESWNRQIREHLVQVDKLIEGATAHWKTERFNMSAMLVEVTDGAA